MTDRQWAMYYAIGLVKIGVLSVDPNGYIWKHKHFDRGSWRDNQPRRAENVGGKGYLRVTLTLATGRQLQIMAHRPVWAYFNGAIPPDDLQINHRDLHKQNNRPSNLELATAVDNISHSHANGRTIPWSIKGASARRDRNNLILAARSEGHIFKDISLRFRISLTQVQRICRKNATAWRWR